MRALTVRQPWAWAIVGAGKDVENRSRNIAGSYRGLVAIHAGVSNLSVTEGMHHPELRAAYLNLVAEGNRPDHRYGAIIGVADLVDVHHATDTTCLICTEGCCGCSTWAMADRWHLTFANPRPLAEPIPYRGRLGLWTLPDDVVPAESWAEHNVTRTPRTQGDPS